MAAEYDRELGKLEKLNAELLTTQTTLALARAKYDSIVTQLNERARAAFIQGPGSSWEFLLGATSMLDLSDRLEYMDAIATSDADLATQVQNTKNVLSAKEKNLAKLQSAQRAVVTKVRAKQQEVQDLLRQAECTFAAIESKKAWAERLAKQLSAKRQAWLRSQFTYGGGTHAAVAMPSGWAGTLQVCPVETAPRLRRRVRRAAVRRRVPPARRCGHPGADGHADLRDVRRVRHAEPERARRPGGGGARGARLHVQRAPVGVFGSLEGQVQAGDIIGYVGDPVTRRAARRTTTSSSTRTRSRASWPASYYGYTVVGSALNPYPLLVDACD